MSLRRLAVPLCLWAFASAAADGPAPAQRPGAGTGTVSGKVSFAGEAPAPEMRPASSDAVCQALHPQGVETRAVDTRGGGLANVLVYVKGEVAGSPAAPVEPVVMDQQGCQYRPSVVVVQVGQPLKIRNSDKTFHNVHSWPTLNAAFNVAQPRQGMEATRTFEKPELLIPVTCDIHSWMRAVVAVLPHPFHAVTGPDGRFTIAGLPAGEYELEAVHAKLKPLTRKVGVKPGASAELDFSIEP